MSIAPIIATLDETCTGCGSCSAACPVHCIEMEADDLGFLRPRISLAKCVGCGRCKSACPALDKGRPDECVFVRWAKANDEDLLLESSSGGIFGLLAKDVLERGGIVIGAAWADGFNCLEHVIVEKESDLDRILRSKYVQSSVDRSIYEGIREALRQGRGVLFSGTGCQVSGLRGYLGKLSDSNLLLTVEVICHGVPSPLLWHRWLDYRIPGYGAEASKVNFRSKVSSWSSYSVLYEYVEPKNGTKQTIESVFRKDWYMQAFLQNASLRQSCYSCPTKRSSGADVTLGDFWGVGKQHPCVGGDDRGISAVITNTERGEAAIQRIMGKCEWGVSTLDAVAEGNPSLLSPVSPHKDRKAFLAAVAKGVPMSLVTRRWSFGRSLSSRVKRALKAVVRVLRRDGSIERRA